MFRSLFTSSAVHVYKEVVELWKGVVSCAHSHIALSRLCKKVVRYPHQRAGLCHQLSTALHTHFNLFRESFPHFPQPLLLKLLCI